MKASALKANHWWADGALVLVTVLWGSTFILVKDAVETVPVFSFLSLRFGVAAIVLFAASRVAGMRYDRAVLKAGGVLGVALFLGFALQTAGLVYTSASKAGFITGLNVILVPMGSALLLRARPSALSIAGVALSAVGMGLLCLQGATLPGKGDLLVLGCAFAFALQVLLVARYARKVDALPLCTVQMATTSVLSLILGAATDGPRASAVSDARVWGAIAFLGLAATAGAFFLQMVAQKHTSATRAALIFALEPVFAALFSWIVAGEGLTPMQWGGGLLILGGIALSEMGPS